MAKATPIPASGTTAAPKAAPRPVPPSEIPMCWVTDPDTPEPYLVNVADVDPARHTQLT